MSNDRFLLLNTINERINRCSETSLKHLFFHFELFFRPVLLVLNDLFKFLFSLGKLFRGLLFTFEDEAFFSIAFFPLLLLFKCFLFFVLLLLFS